MLKIDHNFNVSHDFSTEEKWIFRGSQRNCIGAVSELKAEYIREKLQALAPEGIVFNPLKIRSIIKGGTCTAMSFALIKKYYQMADECDFTIQRLLQLRSLFMASSETMRNRQCAFNTIEVERNINQDYAYNKIESMARYYHFRVGGVSDMIDMKHKENDRVGSTLTCLEKGVYLVRILRPADNAKQEAYGHSMVYIKSCVSHLFYDPNHGIRDLMNTDYLEILKQNFAVCTEKYEVTQIRFFLIERDKERVEA